MPEVTSSVSKTDSYSGIPPASKDSMERGLSTRSPALIPVLVKDNKDCVKPGVAISECVVLVPNSSQIYLCF